MVTTGFSDWQYYLSLFKESWRARKWFRVVVVIALAWAVIQLALQIGLVFFPISDQVGADLQASYLPAAQHFEGRLDLYPQGSLENVESQYLYAPVFAFFFIPFTWLPIQATFLINILLHLIACGFIYILWARIFREFGLEKASRMLIWTLPVWIVFSAFWDDLTYLNIYTFMALIATLLILGLLRENLFQSSIWLTFILATKPQWAVIALVPLLTGRYKFIAKLLLGAAIGYLSLGAVTMLVSNPSYIIHQYLAQFQFLLRLSRDYPWRGPADGFLGYNHSIKQILVYFFGITGTNLMFADLLKFVLLLPLGGIVLWHLIHPARQAASKIPQLFLELAFLLYLGVFIWLDLVWEITLGIGVFTFLLAILETRWEKGLLLAAFIPYAILDIWRIVTYALGAPLLNDSYFAWDYSLYIPLIMIVILLFYGLLVRKLWPAVFLARKTSKPS